MFKVWWAIQLSHNNVFIGKFGSEKNFKIGERLAKIQAKRLIALCALFALQ